MTYESRRFDSVDWCDMGFRFLLMTLIGTGQISSRFSSANSVSFRAVSALMRSCLPGTQSNANSRPSCSLTWWAIARWPSATIGSLWSCSKNIAGFSAKSFPGFNGTEIKTIGDAFLVEFGSALEAAQCAIEIQRTLAKRNHDVTSDRRIQLKIGIHIGDVIHRDGDVYGDGVNIASRIEQLAGAGGICVSMDVERQIRNALEARFEKFGSADLKNIKLPMELFRIVLPWETGAKATPGATQVSKKTPLLAVAAVILLVSRFSAGGSCGTRAEWSAHRYCHG